MEAARVFLRQAPSIPAFYRLFPGERSAPWKERTAFLLPWAPHRGGAEHLGRQLAMARVSENRIYQVVRSSYPNDLIQLRRLVQHIEPKLDWNVFGWTLRKWEQDKVAKQEILEDFFIGSTAETAA
jgi:CRISPR system Cascade subunit CasB